MIYYHYSIRMLVRERVLIEYIIEVISAYELL
jgi:hypothetical protein